MRLSAPGLQKPSVRGLHARGCTVCPVVALLRLRASFSEDDFVAVKMDIEGVENAIVPALIASNTTKLIDAM